MYTIARLVYSGCILSLGWCIVGVSCVVDVLLGWYIVDESLGWCIVDVSLDWCGGCITRLVCSGCIARLVYSGCIARLVYSGCIVCRGCIARLVCSGCIVRLVCSGCIARLVCSGCIARLVYSGCIVCSGCITRLVDYVDEPSHERTIEKSRFIEVTDQLHHNRNHGFEEEYKVSRVHVCPTCVVCILNTIQYTFYYRMVWKLLVLFLVVSSGSE